MTGKICLIRVVNNFPLSIGRETPLQVEIFFVYANFLYTRKMYALYLKIFFWSAGFQWPLPQNNPYAGALYCNITLQRIWSKICLYFAGYTQPGEFSTIDANQYAVDQTLLLTNRVPPKL